MVIAILQKNKALGFAQFNFATKILCFFLCLKKRQCTNKKVVPPTQLKIRPISDLLPNLATLSRCFPTAMANSSFSGVHVADNSQNSMLSLVF